MRIQVEPMPDLGVAMSPSVFDLVRATALSGQLEHASFGSTKPHHLSALVTSLSVSTRPESVE